MAWIDYKKAFDSLPHSWINSCLTYFGISKKHSEVPQEKHGKMGNSLNGHCEEIGQVSIKRGIFQGDSLPPLLFNICLLYTSPSPRD